MSNEKTIELIAKQRGKSFTKKSDIKRIEEARKSGNWEQVFKSSLYRLHSGEYCQLLELTYKK